MNKNRPKPAEPLRDATAKIYETLPDVTTLAMLAAQPRFAELKNEYVCIYEAYSLWNAAKKHVDKLQEFKVWHSEHPIEEPEKWPASYSTFLRLIVKGKDEPESLHRLRRYFRAEREKFEAKFRSQEEPCLSEPEMLDHIEKQILQFNATDMDCFRYQALAMNFLTFWENEVAVVRSRAGKAGAKVKADKAAKKKEKSP